MPASIAVAALALSGAGGAPGYQAAVFGGILALTLLLLAIEKVQRTLVVLVAGGLCLLLADAWGYLDQPAGGHLPVYIQMIEWEVIGIVIGASVFVEVAARSGVFTFLSVKMLKASRGNPFGLLVLFCVLTALFSAFLDNITAMIIVGSLTIVACRKLALDAKPFLVTEGIMTNIGGLLTLISSIPNIIVGASAGISYLTFVLVAGPYTVLALAASLLVARALFGPALRPAVLPEQRQRRRALVNAFDEWETVQDRRFFYTSIAAVVLVILGFALKPQIPVLRDFGIEIIAMGAAVFMLLLHAKDVERDLSNVEWSLVFFFIGLFTVIGVMEKAGVLAAIGRLLGVLTRATGSLGLMWLTAIFSSVTDNIPLAAMLAKIFGPTPAAAAALPAVQWWAVVFGANLGGNITPIGSASTVVAVTLLRKHDRRMSFMEFVRVGVLFAAVQLLLASGYLLILGRLLAGPAGR